MNCSMPEFAAAFRKHFPDMGTSNRFLDPLLSAAYGKPVLDPIALDDALHAKHREAYPADGVSAKDFIARQYGPAAVAWALEAMK